MDGTIGGHLKSAIMLLDILDVSHYQKSENGHHDPKIPKIFSPKLTLNL